MGETSQRPTAAKASVLLTTHKIVIDADDEAHARWLEEALTNDGYRVHREVHRIVQGEDDMIRMEGQRV